MWMSWVNGVQAASDVVSEVERAVEQYSKGVGHLTQKLPLPGDTLSCASVVQTLGTPVSCSRHQRQS